MTDTTNRLVPEGSYILNYGARKMFPEMEKVAEKFNADSDDMENGVAVSLTNEELYIPPDGVKAIGVDMLEFMNEKPKEGAHSAIDKLLAMNTLRSLKPMYGGGEVKPMNYAGGGLLKKKMMGYENGGKVSLPQYVDAVKQVTGALGGSIDEDMYTEEGGFSRLNIANALGVEPESMTIDTLSYESPGSFVFDVKGVSPEGKELSSQKSMRGGSLPIEMVLSRAMGEHASRAKGDSAEAYRLTNEREHLSNILKEIRSNVRFQNGGEVMLPSQPKDPLQIGARQADPSMYQGQTLGVPGEMEALRQSIMQDEMVKKQAVENKAKKSLQLLRLIGMFDNAERIDSPDGVVPAPMDKKTFKGRSIGRMIEPMPYYSK